MNTVRKGYIRPVDFKHGRVDMTHGSGGRAMAQLIEELFLAAFDNDWLRAANDQACFAVQGGRMVMATDSHVVSPLFFPGGDIGCLSVHGTVNDSMAGAKPLYLTSGVILEEGYPLADLKRIVESMAKAAREAGVPIVTGDTKVVEKGKGDGVFINTTGVGVVADGIEVSGNRARPRATRSSSPARWATTAWPSCRFRENLTFETTIASDTQALHAWWRRWWRRAHASLLRDPTLRGGLATTLNEIARQSGVGMRLVGGRHPRAREGRGRLRAPRPRPALRRQRGQADLHLRAGARRRTAGGDARASARRQRRHHRRRARGPAPLRADGDGLRRQAHRRLAHRRAAAEDMLRSSR